MSGKSQSIDHEKDKLLKRLLDAVKQCQIRFGGQSELATELDSRVSCLCSAFESVLQHGMKLGSRSLATLKHVTVKSGLSRLSGLADLNNVETEPAFWYYVRVHLSHYEIQRFERLSNVTTAAGKGRAWLRSALNEHALERYTHMLIENDSLIMQYYEDTAVLMDHEKRNLLPSLAAGLNSILFAIRIDNPDLNTVRAPQPWMFPANEMSDQASQQDPVATIAAPNPEVGQLKKKKKLSSKIVSFDSATSRPAPTVQPNPAPLSLPASPFTHQPLITQQVFIYGATNHDVNPPATPYRESRAVDTRTRRLSTSNAPACPSDNVPGLLQRSPSKTSLPVFPLDGGSSSSAPSPKKGHRKSQSDTSMFKDLGSRLLKSGLGVFKKITDTADKTSSVVSSQSGSLQSVNSLGIDTISLDDSLVIELGPQTRAMTDSPQLASSVDSGGSRGLDEYMMDQRRPQGGGHVSRRIIQTSECTNDLIPLDSNGEPLPSMPGMPTVTSAPQIRSGQVYSSVERTQGDGSQYPDVGCPIDPVITQDAEGMSISDLKEAIMSMMSRKDELEEQIKHLEMALKAEHEVSSELRLEIHEMREDYLKKQEKEAEKIKQMGREIELLKYQLRKYVSAVQLLRQRGICEEDLPGLHLSDPVPVAIPAPPSKKDYSYEASEYENKLIQVAEMHGELMEFNTHLQRQLLARDHLNQSLRRQLEQLRGPLPASIPQTEDDHGIIAAYESGPRQQTLVNLWIPSAFLRGRSSDGFHVYQVFVRILDEEWNVYRRYSEFLDLHKNLKSKITEVKHVPFPPKKAVGNKDSKFVSERRQRLQEYLRHVVDIALDKTPELNQNISRRLLCQTLPFFSPQVEASRGRQRSTSSSRLSANASPASAQRQLYYQGL